MKQLLRLAALMSVMMAAVSCGKESGSGSAEIEVSYHNVSGTWVLERWSGGDLSDGLYLYMELTRRDRRFTLYENMHTAYAHKTTGDYYIYVDESLGCSVIRGMYDYTHNYWSHRYIVSVTENEMTWTATDDAGDVSVYRRCSGIPAEILAEAGDGGSAE